ncbi:MAG TPA: Ig-like domain-containing protein [Woeseiaceae bacterium]|nr:Ig-like domain-containing protein [Woeseiaceae bacterium]
MKARICTTARLAAAVIAAAGALAGCDVETFDDAVARIPEGSTPPPPASPPPPPPPPAAGFGPNFSEIQANVFTPDCATSGCHAGGNPAAGLNLEEASSYAMLVGIQSSQDPALQRVEAGNPDNSYLVQKLEGTASSGQQMAPGAPLPQAEIDVIRQWITDGATDDRVVVLDPITVTSLSPMPNAALDAPPANIVAGFSRELNQVTVDATTFLLTASGGDGTFADGNEAPIAAAAISVPAANPQSAVFDLAGVALADDTYRIQLLGGTTNAILDLDGNALDGEFFGNLPSGNGVAGGDFTVLFTITTPVMLQPTLDEIQAAVFTPTCATSNCHAGGSPAGGLDLSDADTSHAALVNVPSSQGTLLVAPTLPDDSYLVDKIEGTQTAGQRMPLGRAPLSQAEIDAIRQWILDGAAR